MKVKHNLKRHILASKLYYLGLKGSFEFMVWVRYKAVKSCGNCVKRQRKFKRKFLEYRQLFTIAEEFVEN